MLELIIAVDKKYGIGKNGFLPWKCSSELNNFKKITNNSNLIMGRKTCENIPKLKNRKILCMSKQGICENTNDNEIKIIKNIEEYNFKEKEKYFIAGGREIYKYFLTNENYTGFIKIHLSIIKGVYDCDVFFEKEWLDGFVITEKIINEDYTYMTLEYDPQEFQYIKICKEIMENGDIRTGRNGEVKSLFCESMKFDLTKGFPLLTTKKMFFRGIVEELLFFIKGQTDSTILSNKKVNIWTGNTSSEFLKTKNLNYSEGVMGPMYGYQWRYFNKPYKLDENKEPVFEKGGIDQLENVINLIKNDPTSRRIIMTSYNPEQAEEGVLYPCHSLIIQFYVSGEYLDMFCYNRSQDFFLGNPYNIASSSLLLILISKITNKKARFLNMSLGDTHIYKEHYEAVNKQIKNIPYKFTNLIIKKQIKSLEDIENMIYEDFKLENYNSNEIIKAKMIC